MKRGGEIREFTRDTSERKVSAISRTRFPIFLARLALIPAII
jgi:hypothetical protein